MPEVTVAKMNVISSALVIRISTPDTSLELIMQQKKSMDLSSLNMATTDMYVNKIFGTIKHILLKIIKTNYLYFFNLDS